MPNLSDLEEARRRGYQRQGYTRMPAGYGTQGYVQNGDFGPGTRSTTSYLELNPRSGWQPGQVHTPYRDTNEFDWTNYTTDGPAPGSGPASVGSGGGGGGGYGGGGRIKPLSQDAFDRMIAQIRQGASQYSFSPWDAAPYQGTPLRDFDDSIYRQAEGALQRGYAQAGQSIGTGTEYARNALNRNWGDYSDLMALAPQTTTPGMPARVSTLGQNQAVVDEANANAAAQDTFMSGLRQSQALQAQQGQTSRLHELELADQEYRNRLRAQQLADETGLSLAEARALQAWQQRADERAYQDSVMGQQWDREASLANWQGRSETDRANVKTENDMLQARLAPLLELMLAADQAGLSMEGV